MPPPYVSDSKSEARAKLARPEIVRPHVIVAGPEALTIEEIRALRFALERLNALVTPLRFTDELPMSEVREALSNCTWLLLGIDEYPGRELDILRAAEQSEVPIPVGLMSLKDRVSVTDRLFKSPRIELIVRRIPGDTSLSRNRPMCRSMMLVPDVCKDGGADRIARTIIPLLAVSPVASE